MERFTISLDGKLVAAFDELINERGYATRSEAVRDILRAHLQHSAEKRDLKGSCVANLSYVYNHHERELAERLTRIQHAHHDLTGHMNLFARGYSARMRPKSKSRVQAEAALHGICAQEST
jgi:nickel-responsive transcriptional regulator NikR